MTELEYKDLGEKVSSAIREMILRGELAAGQKLVQEELAAGLGVSRTPILAALTKLEKELLVEIIPRRGAFVRKISLDELKDIYDIRVRLEPLGARRAAEKSNPEKIEEIAAILDEFRRGAEAEDMRQVRELDYRFHMAVHRLSGNELLYRMISSYSLVVLCNINRFSRNPLVSYQDHRTLVEAIRVSDSEAAEEIMRRHLEKSRVLLDDLEES